jgi:DNA repair protein RadC
VHALLASELRDGGETFHALLLDGKHRLRRREQVSQGTLTSSLVHRARSSGRPCAKRAAA